MERPPVRYARSGDVHIAYQVTGAGPVDLVWIEGSVSHLDLDWENPYRVRIIERFGSFSRVIRLDKRGTGLSDRPGLVATLEDRVEDIRAVMDAAESERATLCGFSDSGTMACLFAATYPERARSLVLYGTLPRWVRAPDYPWGPSFAEAERGVEEWERAGCPPPDLTSEYRQRWFGPVGKDPAFRDYFARMRRAGTSPAAWVAMVRMNHRMDIRDVLPTIRAPTLVLNRRADPAVPIDAARDLAARIPGARFVELPGEGHLYYDILDEVLDLVEEFVRIGHPERAADRILASILFVDIVGSTERLAALGDAAWRELLARYYALARRELGIFAGVEVDTAGDGLLARFDGPARAIRCARAIQRAARELGLALRAGVHTGEVELADGAIRGMAVHTAARIAALAGADEVYVSSTVRDLVAGSGLAFEDRGLHELKGLPEPRRILAVAGA